MNINEICKLFGIEIINHKEIKKGIINSTNVVESLDGEKYILQEINHNVFKNIDGLMSNIEKVTDHIRLASKREGREDSGTLNILKANGKSYIIVFDENKNVHYYRMYEYVDNVLSVSEASGELLFEAGVALGRFQRQLEELDANDLIEIMPNFHNTLIRYDNFEKALQECRENDVEKFIKAKSEIEYAREHKNCAGLIINALQQGKIPQRIVHNDTKLDNVLFDKKTKKAKCLIDLDTIMPGSMLFDYGDAIRFSANAGKEDDINLDNVKLSIDKFSAFTAGFLKEVVNVITPNELKLMPYAPIVLSYELGLRFLTDYLEGSRYFKCDKNRPDHNLERAKAQFKLTQDLEKNVFNMKLIIDNYFNQHKIENFVSTVSK